jgi:citrate synthase
MVEQRKRQRLPRAAAATALDWGLPVLETRLCRIEGGRFFYRGVDAAELAERATIEETAALLWDRPEAAFEAGRRAAAAPRGGGPLDRALTALVARLPGDPAGQGRSRDLERAGGLVCRLAEGSLGTALADGPLHTAIAKAWRKPRSADAVRRALVLCADHELNASSFALRVAASTGASLTACLIAGLATFSGPAHGGASERVSAFLDEIGPSPGEAAVAARLTRGDELPGFGHPLYPEGDVRALALLPHCRTPPGVAAAIEIGSALTGRMPNIDFALVALERGHRLPRGAAQMLFAIGRSVGWIAHALEQKASRQLIRPRARYIG